MADDFGKPKILDECYAINQKGTFLFVNMKEKRSEASSIVYDNKLWITGGKKFQVHIYGLCFFWLLKKVALSKYAVVKLNF